eukprot:c29295_g1_i1 orf=182-2299(-)
MDLELRAAKEKWEREQKQRKEQARVRLEREKKAREEALRQREALEAARRQRRLEEAEAAAVAQLREEEDLFAGDGVIFNKVLEAAEIPGDGDKIRLPPSTFGELSSQGALEKGPMLFEISVILTDPDNASTGNRETARKEHTTHAGVLQFTAPEGSTELPSHVWENLGLLKSSEFSKERVLVRVRYVRLPKGTYAKLQPEVVDFADVPNHKAVLETKLRQHATLSEGDLLTVQHGGVDYRLGVLELKPSSSVSVLETDMEVDVVEPQLASSQSILVPLAIGSPGDGLVEEGCYKYYRFTIDQKLADLCEHDDVDIIVRLELDGGVTSDADLYVAMHPVLFPTQHQHQWSSHDVGSKIICLTDSGKILRPGAYSLAIYGFRGTSNYRILVEVHRSRKQKTQGHRVGVVNVQGEGSSLQSTDSQTGEGFDQCGNCKQFVPVKTITLHEAYCRRHNVVCQYEHCGMVLKREEMETHVHCSKCGQAFGQEELAKHMKVYHDPQTCKCGAILEKEEMVSHQAMKCSLRMIMCRFCGDLVQAGDEVQDPRDRLQGLTEHESICGSRTSPCDSCGRSVMLKEMDLHIAAAHSSQIQLGGRALEVSPMSVDLPRHAEVSRAQVEGDAARSSVGCPICGDTFVGLDVEAQLAVHLDHRHFSAVTSDSSKISLPNISEVSQEVSSYRRSLSVSCPICGLAVHSERDLSLHMDMVH